MCRTTLEQYKEYYNGLKTALDSHVESYIGNSGHGHNAVVMRLMLENSREINMYCGSLSVFSNPFFDEIAKTDSQEAADYLKNKLKDVLLDFLKEDGRLNIILENYSDDWLSEIIIASSEWNEYIRNNQIKVRYIPDALSVKKNINHVAFNNANTIERLEIDKLRHVAICRINSSGKIDDQFKMFETLINCSKPIVA